MAFDFPSSPTIGQSYLNYVWDGEKWTTSGSMLGAVRYDIAQGLTSAQKAQARSNIDVLKKNYIINGAMQVSQENGDTVGSTNGYYMCDMWRMVAVTTGVMQTQRVQVATPSGATDRIRLAVNTADTSIAASEQVQLFTAIELSLIHI